MASLAMVLLASMTTWSMRPQMAQGESPQISESEPITNANKATDLPSSTKANGLSRLQILAGSLTVFALAVFVGFEIIAKVPPTLHTPLMSGSNAISGITVVGAIIATGQMGSWIGNFLGMLAIVLAMVNVVGGFYVTHRMLLMFKRK
jgi:H+-translocating NAD(P) transhydrogenase subunit alpha